MEFIKKIILLLLFLLLLVPIALSIKPLSQTSLSVEGLVIEYPKIEALKLNSDFIFNFHIYNASDGIPRTNRTIDCSFHLYDNTGEHLYVIPRIPWNNDDKEFEAEITGTNFSYAGDYAFITECNNSVQGGFVSVPFIVNLSGVSTSDFTTLGFIILFIVMIGIYLVTLFNIVGHMAKSDVDVLDVAYSMTIYFAILAFNAFNITYLGNVLIGNMTDLFISIGAITHIFIPIVGLAITLIVSQIKKKKDKEDSND